MHRIFLLGVAGCALLAGGCVKVFQNRSLTASGPVSPTSVEAVSEGERFFTKVLDVKCLRSGEDRIEELERMRQYILDFCQTGWGTLNAKSPSILQKCPNGCLMRRADLVENKSGQLHLMVGVSRNSLELRERERGLPPVSIGLSFSLASTMDIRDWECINPLADSLFGKLVNDWADLACKVQEEQAAQLAPTGAVKSAKTAEALRSAVSVTSADLGGRLEKSVDENELPGCGIFLKRKLLRLWYTSLDNWCKPSLIDGKPNLCAPGSCMDFEMRHSENQSDQSTINFAIDPNGQWSASIQWGRRSGSSTGTARMCLPYRALTVTKEFERALLNDWASLLKQANCPYTVFPLGLD